MPPPGASEKPIQRPSGDHWRPLTWSSRAVTWRGKPPSAATVQTWGTPVKVETKAMRDPSGEKLGEVQEPMRAMRVTAAVRSAAASESAESAEESAGAAGFAGIALPAGVAGVPADTAGRARRAESDSASAVRRRVS